MSSSDVEKSSKDKEHKTVPAFPQEQSSATITGAVNAEWPVFQAFSPMPGHTYLASSPQAHPYMWGMQHVVPPYGAPPPYIAMYPHHGGMYAHPHMAPGSYPFSPFPIPSPTGAVESGTTPSAIEANGKSEGKEKLPIKRSKGSVGSLNMITGKNSDAAESANEGYSKSGETESGSEGSSDGSDANSQNDSQPKSGDRQDSREAETSHNGSSLQGSQNGGGSTPKIALIPAASIVPVSSRPHGGLPGPATNLNIGMEYWGAPATSASPVLQGKIPSIPAGRANLLATGDVQPQLWPQDERELKRQRRKQSNRESARRSRLRKQAECDELAQQAGVLKEENATLRAEVNRIKNEYEKLSSENTSLKERLGEKSGNEEDTRSSSQNVGKDTR